MEIAQPQELQNTAAPLVSQNGALDLSRCDLEQVHFPGAIIPSGMMLILDGNDYHILGASANAATSLGITGVQLAGRNLGCCLCDDTRQMLETALAEITEAVAPRYLGCINTFSGLARFDTFAHRSGEFLLVELEMLPPGPMAHSQTMQLAQVSDCLAALQGEQSWQDSMATAVRQLRKLTGFDSVLGIKILEDGSMQAIAEARGTELPSFLDKRFPRSDIPQPGRRQMQLMPVQYAPDIAYVPVPLVMFDKPGAELMIDLSLALLRSKSPLCNRFYLNVGVRARFVLSLVEDGKLWGFFSCWNATPKPVSFADRLVCQSFAQMAGRLLVEKNKSQQDRAALDGKRRIDQATAGLHDAGIFTEASQRITGEALEILDSSGFAICLSEQIVCKGNCPPLPLIRALASWLDSRDTLIATDRLPSLFEPAAGHTELATGLIAARLLEPGNYLLAFRSEWIHEVQWAGDPQKPVAVDVHSGEARLTARGSFDVWTEEVRGLARPWEPHIIEAMKDLQYAVMLSQHAHTQSIMNSLLQRSNAELEDFAYIVSHDLKEPLRGIQNFADFLRNKSADRMDSQQLAWLDVITRLSIRLRGQIDSLLRYSRAGRQNCERVDVDLNILLRTVFDGVAALISEKGVNITIPREFPYVRCDKTATIAIFENLITNAAKYNDKLEKRVEIGYLEGATLTFYVRDNGIGIDSKYHDQIFNIFRRLHGRDEFGGGYGTGLTIARRHAERQGGRLWLESEPGVGSTFYFTLTACSEPLP